MIVAYLIANLGFALIQTLLAYFITYQLGMGDQMPIVMALLLVSIGVFLVPWRMMSDRWNKGPAYALGLGIGGLAIASTFLLPHEPTPADLPGDRGGGHRLLGQLGLSLVHGARRGRV